MTKSLPNSISDNRSLFDTAEQQKALREAITMLPEDQQKVLQLHYEKQLTIKEIANQLDYSSSTIYNKLYRGLHTLKLVFNPSAFEKTYKILYPETGKPISY